MSRARYSDTIEAACGRQVLNALCRDCAACPLLPAIPARDEPACRRSRARCDVDNLISRGYDVIDDGGGCSKYESIDYGSFAYFLVACLIFLACIVGFIILERSPFARYYDSSNRSEADAKKTEAYSRLASEPEQGVDQEHKIESKPRGTPPELEDYRRVLFAVRREAFSVWFVFSVTIALFPAITARIRPFEPLGCGGQGIFTDATFTACLFVLFNLLDLIGRSSAGFLQVNSCAIFLFSFHSYYFFHDLNKCHLSLSLSLFL